MFFKFGPRNAHHKRWQHSWLQSLSVKNQIAPFATSLSGTVSSFEYGSHVVLTIPIRLLGVDNPCLSENLGILVTVKT